VKLKTKLILRPPSLKTRLKKLLTHTNLLFLNFLDQEGPSAQKKIKQKKDKRKNKTKESLVLKL